MNEIALKILPIAVLAFGFLAYFGYWILRKNAIAALCADYVLQDAAQSVLKFSDDDLSHKTRAGG